MQTQTHALNFRLRTIDGAETETVASILLANEMVNQPHGPAERLYDWAVTLMKTGALELQPGEDQFLIDWILRSPTMTVLAKVQIVRALRQQPLSSLIESLRD